MLRNRHPGSNSNIDNVGEDAPFMMDMDNNIDQGCTAQQLLKIGPTKSSWLEKKNDSFLSLFCPCSSPSWKPRYFILIGNFLFRFREETSSRPKGVPIPIDSATVSLDTEHENCFRVYTVRKNYIIRAKSKNEAISWINAVNERKAQVIKENLGHSHSLPAVKKVNGIASSLFQTRLDKDKLTDDTMNPMYAQYGKMTEL